MDRINKTVQAGIILTLILYGMAAFNFSPGNTQPEATPKGTVDQFMHALDHADWEGWISTMDEECTMYFPFSSRMAKNRAEIESVFRGVFDRLNRADDHSAPFFNFKPKDMHVQTVGDSVAAVTWYLELEEDVEGRRSAILKKTKQGWKIIHFHADRFRAN